MDEAIDELYKLIDKNLENDDFPVAAVIFDETGVISSAYNSRNKTQITIDHAEISAIIKANKKVNSWRLPNVCMLTSLEPCDMCKNVIKEARIKQVYYLIPRYNYKYQYKNTRFHLMKLEDKKLTEYKRIIRSFFKDKR